MSYFKDCINDIKILNEDFFEVLDKLEEFAKSDAVRNLKTEGDREKAEDWVGEEYRKHIIEKGYAHDGYPEKSKSKNLWVGEFRNGSTEEDIQMTKKVTELNNELQSFLGVRNNALFMIYPPGGFISWHNNQNASGYNVILTWSEEGDGYWQHVDPVTKELVTIPDVKGWQCKSGYYGSYEDGMDKVVYHAAATNCWRMTVAFVYNRSQAGKQMAEMMLEDISNNYK